MNSIPHHHTTGYGPVTVSDSEGSKSDDSRGNKSGDDKSNNSTGGNGNTPKSNGLDDGAGVSDDYPNSGIEEERGASEDEGESERHVDLPKEAICSDCWHQRTHAAHREEETHCYLCH